MANSENLDESMVNSEKFKRQNSVNTTQLDSTHRIDAHRSAR